MLFNSFNYFDWMSDTNKIENQFNYNRRQLNSWLNLIQGFRHKLVIILVFYCLLIYFLDKIMTNIGNNYKKMKYFYSCFVLNKCFGSSEFCDLASSLTIHRVDMGYCCWSIKRAHLFFILSNLILRLINNKEKIYWPIIA